MIAGRSLHDTGAFPRYRESRKNGSGRIAQLVEQLTLNQRVLGSSPSASTISFKDLAAILERLFKRQRCRVSTGLARHQWRLSD